MKKAVLRKVKKEKEIVNGILRNQLVKCTSDSQQLAVTCGTLSPMRVGQTIR